MSKCGGIKYPFTDIANMLYNLITVEYLVLPSGRCPVESFLAEPDDKTLAKILRLLEILKVQKTLPFPYARKMQGYKNLWELRVLSKGMAIRIFYTYWGKNKIVLVSGFVKKSQTTPRRELDRTIQYLKESGVTP